MIARLAAMLVAACVGQQVHAQEMNFLNKGAVLIVGSDDDDAVTIAGTPTYKDILRPDLLLTRKAYGIFEKQCPHLHDLLHWTNSVVVTDKSATFVEEARERRWTIGVSVEVEFGDRAISLAREQGSYLPRYSLFLLGGGSAPGVLSMTSGGLTLCRSNNSANFLPIPELRILKQWPSDIAFRRANPHMKLDNTLGPYQ